MRLIHTSDWHLGHEIHGFGRGFEHDVFLGWLADLLKQRSADVLLVTGDIYDVVNPPTSAQRRLYRFLASVLQALPTLQVVLTGGNHDSAARLELPHHLLGDPRVVIIGTVPRTDGLPDPKRLVVHLHDRTRAPRAILAAIPYLRPADLPAAEGEIDGLAVLHRDACAAADRARGVLPLIVTGHLHVSGGIVSAFSERRVLIGGSEVVSTNVFPAHAAYVALGHLHRPQKITGPTTIRYAGSPFPLSMTEREYRHGVVQVDLDEQGHAAVELLPAPRPVQFLRVPRTGAASLDEVEAELLALSLDDCPIERQPFLEVVIQVDGPVPDLRRRVDRALKDKSIRLVRIGREPTAREHEDRLDRGLSEISEIDVFSRLHADQHGGHAPADDLLDAFRHLLADVRSYDPGEASP